MLDTRHFIPFFALLQAEEPVPLAAYIIVALIGACVVWAVLRRELLGAARDPLAPAVVAAAASIVFALAMVVSIGYQTAFFVRHGMREVGTASQRLPVMPEPLVTTARAVLHEHDRWALITPSGRCEDDQYRYFWLAFRLLPNIPDCHSPNIEIFFRVPPPTNRSVVRTDAEWEIVRR
jgi:hypothetical protein